MPPFPEAPGADRATVLAVDTTAGACSVALLGPGASAHRSEPMVHGHSRHVLGLVDAVLAQAGIAPSVIDAIGFGAGPGSFTGLRIACGIAQGLGFGWNRPVVPVDAMRTLALQAADAAAAGADWIWVALDLRMGEVCRAAFRVDAPLRSGAWREPAIGPVLGTPEAAAEAFAALGAVSPVRAGDGWSRYPALGDGIPAGTAVPSGAVQPDAMAVARLAIAGLRGGRGVDAADAAPTYLRDKVALDVGEQAALRAARAAEAKA
jgi:tRNA threonylcarbamoyladenosine biosynthesis protein TsaB